MEPKICEKCGSIFPEDVYDEHVAQCPGRPEDGKAKKVTIVKMGKTHLEETLES